MEKLDINTLVSIREYLGQKLDKKRTWSSSFDVEKDGGYQKDYRLLSFFEKELYNEIEKYYIRYSKE